MRIINKVGTFKSRPRIIKPKMVILHHTAGYHNSSVRYLKQKGFGYHYMIDREGKIYQYVDDNRRCSHAYRRNSGTIGVCFVAGAPVGPVTDEQLEAVVPLLKTLKSRHTGLQELSGHKHQDPRSRRGRYNKIDPTFEGEPGNSVNWEIDQRVMAHLAAETGLVFVSARSKLDPDLA